MKKTSNDSGRKAKNEATRRRNGGNGVASNVHRVDLEVEELDVLVKACQKFRASLPGYLASAQADVARADALISRLQSLVKKG